LATEAKQGIGDKTFRNFGNVAKSETKGLTRGAATAFGAWLARSRGETAMLGLVPSDMFLFEDFRLDRRGGLFRRDDNGAFVPVAIGSRALDILGVLIERAGEIVSKDDLLAAVWPETVVDYSNLTVQTAALRRVLDRGRSNGSCIQTVSGRGYRFIAPVTRSAADIGPGAPVSAHEHLWVFARDGVEPSVPLAKEPPLNCSRRPFFRPSGGRSP